MGEIIGCQIGYISLTLMSLALVERIALSEMVLRPNERRIATFRHAIKLAECGVIVRLPEYP